MFQQEYQDQYNPIQAWKFVFRNASGVTTLTNAMQGRTPQEAFDWLPAFVKTNVVVNDKNEVQMYGVSLAHTYL